MKSATKWLIDYGTIHIWRRLWCKNWSCVGKDCRGGALEYLKNPTKKFKHLPNNLKAYKTVKISQSLVRLRGFNNELNDIGTKRVIVTLFSSMHARIKGGKRTAFKSSRRRTIYSLWKNMKLLGPSRTILKNLSARHFLPNKPLTKLHKPLKY